MEYAVKRVCLLFLMLSFSMAQKMIVLEASFILALSAYFHPVSIIFPVQDVCSMAEKRHIIQLELFLFKGEKLVATTDVSAINTIVTRTLYVMLWDGDRAIQKIFHRLYPSDAYWLLLADNFTSLEHLLGAMDIPFDCQLLVAVETQGAVELTEVYRVHESRSLVTSRWGAWSYKEGLSSPKANFYQRRANLQGVPLITVVSNRPSLTFVDKKTRSYFGYLPDMFCIIAEHLNFSAVVEVKDESKAGVRQPNGSWTGLIGLVATAPGNFIVMSGTSGDRAEVVDLTVPVDRMFKNIYIRRPEDSRKDWRTYFLPFELSLWLALTASGLLIACYCIVLRYLLPSADRYRVKDVPLWVLGTFCSQGLDVIPRQTSTRLVWWISFIVGVIAMAAYGASFTSFLAVRKAKLPFKTLRELLDNENYGFMLRPGGLSYKNFKYGEGLMQEIYKKKIEPFERILPMTSKEESLRICSGKYAVLRGKISSQQDMKDLSCQVVLIPGYKETIYGAWMFTKKSPYRRIVNHMLVKMWRSGVIQRLASKWRHLLVDEESTALRSVELEDIQPLLVLCAAGSLLGVLILLVELFLAKKRGSVSHR